MLKPVEAANQDNLICATYMKLARAIERLRAACDVDIPLDIRKGHLDGAREELNCAVAHLAAAIDDVPLE